MSYIRLFFSLLYHGIRARLYLWALEYVVDYQHSKPPLTILGGGNEWPVMYDDDLLHTCGTCGAPLQAVRPGGWQCVVCPPIDPSNLKPEDRP